MFLKKRGAPKAPTESPAPSFLVAPATSARDPVRVTLSDCLACSGCITSAETVLLEAQSAEEFKTRAREAAASGGRRVVVVSVSPQSRASLAHAAGLDALDAARRLAGFFKNVAGAAYVFDTTASRDLSLLESCEEFVERYRAASSSAPGAPPLPVLTSACPGWVCYAEKTHGATVLRHVSAVKSPQQVMGSIVKRHVADALGLAPDAVFHATVMPCFDKKLEASREDFKTGEASTAEVDCVLTTGEVAEMIAEAAGASGGDPRAGAAALASVPPAALDGWLASAGSGLSGNGSCSDDTSEDANASSGGAFDAEMADADPEVASGSGRRSEWLWGVDAPGGGGGSGGYLDTVFRHAARVLHGVEVTGPLEYKTPRARNPDLREVTLEVGGVTVLRFATAYGFRNIQNVVRRCKAGVGAGGYHFVEIMACPSGCLNGGGQLPPPPAVAPGTRLDPKAVPTSLGGMSAKQLVDELEELYYGRGGVVVPRHPSRNPDVAALYREWVGGGVGSAAARALLHTAYHDRGAEAAAAAGGAAAAAAQLKVTSDW